MRRGTRLSKNYFDYRRDDGAVSEIRWVFLVFRDFWTTTMPLPGTSGHHHNNRQKIVYAQESTERGGEQD
jgi:hypothetical protein